MDAEFLKTSVGKALASAVTSMVIKQPEDAVEYLGNFLLDYVATQEKEEAKKDKLSLLREIKKQQDELAAQEEAIKVKAENAAKELKDAEDKFVESISGATDITTFLPELFDRVKSDCKASFAYFSKKANQAEGAPYLKYYAASTGNEFLIGKTLKGPIPGADEEESGEEGVTFQLWKPLPEPEPTEDVDADAPPAGPKFMDYLLVDNVVRDAKVKNFSIPKLGCYLAIPLKYNSYIHDSGITKKDPSVVNEKHVYCQPEEGAEEPTVDPTTAVCCKNPIETDIVLGIDTTGMATVFDEKAIENGLKWGKIYAASIEASEERQWEEELARLKNVQGKEESSAEALAGLTDALNAEGGEAEGADKLQAQVAFLQKSMLEKKDLFSDYLQLLINPGFGLCKMMSILCSLFSNVDVTDWEDVKAAWDTTWTPVVQTNYATMEINSLPSPDKVAQLKEACSSVEESTVASCYVASLIQKYINLQLDFINATREKKQAELDALEAQNE